MLVVDTSALVAILFHEPTAERLSECIEAAAARLISAANYIELGTVLTGNGTIEPRDAARGVDRILASAEIDVAPVTDELARIALQARIDYGKGFGTRKGLNFGDCFAYALAKQHKAPLLFVGDDFSRTDIESAL
jgi:ribonuclease VapC